MTIKDISSLPIILMGGVCCLRRVIVKKNTKLLAMNLHMKGFSMGILQ